MKKLLSSIFAISIVAIFSVVPVFATGEATPDTVIPDDSYDAFVEYEFISYNDPLGKVYDISKDFVDEIVIESDENGNWVEATYKYLHINTNAYGKLLI